MIRVALVAPALAALALSVSSPLGAQEVKRLEPVVVTATKVETPQAELGASVTVITGEEIRTYNYAEFQDVLRQVPGVEIQRFGGLGKNSNLRIRGANPNQVQVLVDGMRVKSPTLGSAELSELTLDSIERIEVVRGPQSTLHGADAIGGVVNIITKKGAGPVRGDVHLQAGSASTVRERASLQGAYRGFSFNVSASHYDTRGRVRRFDNDDAEQTGVAGRIDYDLPWKGDLTLSGRYSKTEADLAISSTTPPPTVFDPNFQQQNETWLYNLAYTQRVFGWWDVSARLGQWWNNVGAQNPEPPAFDAFGVVTSQVDTRRRELELVQSFRPATWNTTTVGVEHRHERGESRGFFGFFFPAETRRFTKTLDTFSVFGQEEVRVLDRVFLSGGLRWEDSSEFDEALTPRVSAAVVVKETGTKIRGGWGKGFRVPTMNDLLFPGFGNAGLRPETSESYEAGADQKFWDDRIRLGATYFHNEFMDLIQFRTVAGAPFGVLPVNVARARTQGVETSVELEPVDWLLFSVNYTAMSTVDKGTHQELARFPRHRWSFSVTLTPVPDLSLFVQTQVVSSQLETLGSGRLRNPGYHRFDAGGTYRLAGRACVLGRLELTSRIENVTDEQYSEIFGVRAPGFTALVGLRATFP